MFLIKLHFLIKCNCGIFYLKHRKRKCIRLRNYTVDVIVFTKS